MQTDDGLLVVGADEGMAGPGDIVVKLQASQTGGRWDDAAGAADVRRRHGTEPGRDRRDGS